MIDKEERMIARTLAYMRRNAVACVALFIALGGTATASHLVVRASDIQANAVRGQHIKPNTVKRKHVHARNLSALFGRGVVGARGVLGPVNANVAGLASVPPLGGGDDFSLPIPRHARVRDLVASSTTSLPRPVEVRVRNGTEVVIACTIAAGTQTCDAGKQTATLARGDLLNLRLFAPAAPVAVGSTTYQIGYRISP